jgi:hypothetical protein
MALGHDTAARKRGGRNMNTAGWIVMTLSVSFVLSLTIFCFYRVLRTPQSNQHMHAPLDIDTHDAET